MAEPLNPPAFPQQCADALDVGMVHEGMTLRDWFAGQVLTSGDASKHYQCGPHETRIQAEARYCFERADAMLAARTTTPEANS